MFKCSKLILFVVRFNASKSEAPGTMTSSPATYCKRSPGMTSSSATSFPPARIEGIRLRTLFSYAQPFILFFYFFSYDVLCCDKSLWDQSLTRRLDGRVKKLATGMLGLRAEKHT